MTAPADPNDEVLAGEYVLHLLDAEDRQRVEYRLRDDQRFQELVYQWEARFASIANEIEEVDPPAALKAAILAKVTSGPQKTSVARNWLIGALSMTAVALFAFIAVGPLFTSDAPQAEFQSELVSEDRSLILVASVIPATHEIVIDRLAGQPPAGRVFELWLIAEGSATPVSLGLLGAEDSTRIRVPDAIAPGVRTGTIAISEEPIGGSLTGTPTGEVLATGKFDDL